MAVCSIRSSPAETIGGHHDRTRQTSSATLGDSRLRPVARIQHSVSEPDRADPADRRVLQVIEPGLARPDRGDLLAARAVCAASQLRLGADRRADQRGVRSEEPTSELQSLMRLSYPVFCLNNKNLSLLYES